MEGAEHKKQRRLIGPAFTNQAVKAMAPIFFQKAEELRDRWDALISETPTTPQPHDLAEAKSTPPEDSAVLDVSHWVSRATFDAIGLAGFDYNFHSLKDETEEVYLAYRKMFNVADKGPGLKGLVQLYLPFVEKIFVSCFRWG
jgi:cytochrome P450